jgi:hypothetical protein
MELIQGAVFTHLQKGISMAGAAQSGVSNLGSINETSGTINE